jgi:hypothetical protein
MFCSGPALRAGFDDNSSGMHSLISPSLILLASLANSTNEAPRGGTLEPEARVQKLSNDSATIDRLTLIVFKSK